MARFRLIKTQIVAVPLGALLAVTALSAPARAQAAGQWQFTGSLATGHDNSYLAQLRDGRVLAISGGSSSGVYTPAAEVYDPDAGQWTPAGTLSFARAGFGRPSVL